jgi:hypothetical protein
MYVRITADTAELVEPENVRSFHAVVPAGFDAGAVEAAVAASDVGTVTPDGEHVLVRVDALRRLAAGRVPAGWDDDLAGMVAYAATKGWTDDDGTAVRAHVERE